jgi:hypothetical protein
MGRPRNHDGVVYRRKDTQFGWMSYRDNLGRRHEEPAKTVDWKEAQQRLRERRQARDDRVLDVVRKGGNKYGPTAAISIWSLNAAIASSVSGTSATPIAVFEPGIQTTAFRRSTCSFFVGVSSL